MQQNDETQTNANDTNAAAETGAASAEVETTGTMTNEEPTQAPASDAEPQGDNGELIPDPAAEAAAAAHVEQLATIEQQRAEFDAAQAVRDVEDKVRAAFRWIKNELTGLLGFDHDCDHLKAAEQNAVDNIQPADAPKQ